jgi:MYXO-CTERM domain-containing protein
MAGGSYSFRFQAGETPGLAAVRARVPDGFEATTTLTLLAPPEPTPIDHMDVCVAGVGSPGASTVSLFLRIAPRNRDGILVGGARDVTATADGMDVPLIYRTGEYLATLVVPSDRSTTTVSAIDRGSRLPARPGSPLEGGITVPSQLLAATTIGNDPWFGEERCASARGSPDGGVGDGGDTAIDGSASDASGFDASDATRGDAFVPSAVSASGGCACAVGSPRDSHSQSTAIGLLVLIGAVEIRRRRRAS